jgi:hypothetical protein
MVRFIVMGRVRGRVIVRVRVSSYLEVLFGGTDESNT